MAGGRDRSYSICSSGLFGDQAPSSYYNLRLDPCRRAGLRKKRRFRCRYQALLSSRTKAQVSQVQGLRSSVVRASRRSFDLFNLLLSWCTPLPLHGDNEGVLLRQAVQSTRRSAASCGRWPGRKRWAGLLRRGEERAGTPATLSHLQTRTEFVVVEKRSLSPAKSSSLGLILDKLSRESGLEAGQSDAWREL